jgi:hypothetical protein
VAWFVTASRSGRWLARSCPLSFVVSQAILAGGDADVSITDRGAFPALLGATLVGPVCALIGLGLGVLIRLSATTTVTGVVLLLMLPSFFTTHRHGPPT